MATYVITEACIGVKDATCVDVCPVACIHTTPDAPMYYIDPDVCIACEQCFFVCPVDAIYLDADVPPRLQHYVQINADFFRERKAGALPISEERANRVVDAVRSYARNAGTAVAIVVVTAAGDPMIRIEMEGTDGDAAQRAENKAYTSARLEVATHQLARGAERPSVSMPDDFDKERMLAEAGGYPILDGGDVVGAIGVAGSASPQQDLQCCQAGLAALRGP
jgi:ferredoxin